MKNNLKNDHSESGLKKSFGRFVDKLRVKNSLISRALFWCALVVLTAMTPATSHALVWGDVICAGGSWMGGQGVDVHYNQPDGGCGNGDYFINAPCGLSVDTGCKWQCVELAQRLYTTRGWYCGKFSGVACASDIYNSAGSLGMTAHANGGGYVPVAGDMVVWAPNCPGITGSCGHVALVDSVDAGHVYICEQNSTWNNTGRRTLIRSGTGGSLLYYVSGDCILGTVHSPANVSLPHYPAVASAGSRLKGDFNGDGKDDVVIAYNYGTEVKLWTLTSTGSAFSLSQWWASTGGWSGANSQWVAGDFDGDGKTDVVCLFNYGNNSSTLWFFKSTGSSFNSPVSWWHSDNWDATRSKIVAGDFNGDGKDDVTIAYDHGNAVTKLWNFTSTGSAFQPANEWWTSTGGWAWTNSQWVVGNFTGDTKADIVCLYDYNAADVKLWGFTSSGSGFSLSEWWHDTGGWNARLSHPMAADPNGDGKTDIVIAYNYTGHTTLWTFNSTGSAFNSPVSWWHDTGGWDATLCKWVAGDFTGGGKDDVTCLYDCGGTTSRFSTFTSTGSSFVSPVTWWSNSTFAWGNSTPF